MKQRMVQNASIDGPQDNSPEPPLRPAAEIMEESMVAATKHLAARIGILDSTERARRYLVFIEKVQKMEDDLDG